METLPNTGNELIVATYPLSQWTEAYHQFNVPASTLLECNNIKVSKLDYYGDFNFGTLRILNLTNILGPKKTVAFYMKKNMLILVCDGDIDSYTTKVFSNLNLANLSYEKLVYHFFSNLFINDTLKLEQIETSISKLEQMSLEKEKDMFTKKLFQLKKELIILKNYYEQLLNVSLELEANENDIFDDTNLWFDKTSKRLTRLSGNVQMLFEYTMQVREEYQAQIDINLNNIMKLLTVISMIFMPLTLIAGWYGMNFNMPEYKTSVGYPLVILLSIVIIMLCIYIFKRKDWL